ncbi:MAG: TldD/PmbA family protein, partial [Clostridiales bacterium]|nr:TldD/PmbA family protein [Clostridiales bacterium]
MRDILCYKSLFTHDTRLRLQENSSVAISILNGDVVANQRSRSGGVSAGVTVSGSSGFASSPGYDDETVRKVLKAAQDNAVFLDSRLRRQGENLPSKPGKGKYIYGKKSELTQSATMEFMRALDDYMKKFPSLISRNLFVSQLCTEKSIVTSDGAEYEGFSPRCNLVLSMSALREGKPVAEREVLGGLGVFETMFSSPEEIFPVIDDLYEALRRKTEGIYPEKGQKICILDADLAGILAHEAIGHTVEADFVSAGSVARN